MFKIKRIDNRMEISHKESAIIIVFCITLFTSLLVGMVVTIALEGWSVEDIVVLCLCCMTMLLVFTVGFYESSELLLIDDKGITYTAIGTRKFIPWSLLKDFGISYSGHIKYGGSVSTLYFSKEIQEEKNKHSKRLKGDLIKIKVYGNEAERVRDQIIPFCSAYTEIEPYRGKSS